MTLCTFCSANIPSDQLDSHINNNHPTFVSSKPTKNRSFLSHNMWQSADEASYSTTAIGKVYDDDILKPLIFLDGKRIKENLKKHKRDDHRNHNKRPYKRRKLSHTKHKKKHKPKPEASTDDIEEGEEDPYGGLPYHFHLATHIEPKFIPIHRKHAIYTNIKTLLNDPQNQPILPTMHSNLCKLHDIEYKDDHLSLPWSDGESDWTEQCVQNIDNIHVCGASKMDKYDMNRLIIADLTQYNFITNAAHPSPTPPPIVIPPKMHKYKNKPSVELPPAIEIRQKARKLQAFKPMPLTLPTLKTPQLTSKTNKLAFNNKNKRNHNSHSHSHGNGHGHGRANSHSLALLKLNQMLQRRNNRSQMICIEDLSQNRINNNASPTASNTTSNSTNSMNSMTINMVNEEEGHHHRIPVSHVNILNTLNALSGNKQNMNLNSMNMANKCRNPNGYALDLSATVPQQQCNASNNTFSLLQNFNLSKFNNSNLNLNRK